MRFDTKIAVVLREDLPVWQKLNVTAFMVSGIAARQTETVGENYVDGSGTYYLPMFRQPVLVFAGSGEAVRAAYERAMAQNVKLAIFTDALFATGNDVDNRAAVKAVAREDLTLAGIAFHADRKLADKVLKGLVLHP
jgi:hypothetical protein